MTFINHGTKIDGLNIEKQKMRTALIIYFVRKIPEKRYKKENVTI